MEEIDLKQLLKLFWKRKVLIIIIVLLGCLIGYFYNVVFMTPKYKATATFLLSSAGDNDSKAITTTELTLNSKILNNYTELIKSDVILDEAISRTGIVIDKQYVKKNITINVKKDTEFVELSVALPQKEYAAVIANSIIEVLDYKVKDMYNMDNVRLVDSAKEPTSPYNFNPFKYAAIGGAIGLVVSAGLILILNLFDDTIKTESDVEDKLRLKVIATFRKQNHPTGLDWNPKSDHVEAFRTLRTNLQFSSSSKDTKTIAVSSIYPGEGKSWVTTNLALAYAKADYKVLLVDCDLRKGVQHRKFGVSQKPGFVDLVRNSGKDDNVNDWTKYIRETEIKNLYLIPSGGNIDDSSELLLSNKLKMVINKLKNKFDIVIFDSTPSALVTDAIVLSRLVDNNIIVTECEKTKIKDLKKMKTSVQNIGGKITGVIINKMHSKDGSKYYYYGSEEGLVAKGNRTTRR